MDAAAATASSVDESAPWPPRALAWWTVATLAFAYAVSILDRVALGFLVTPIEADLHLSDTQIGLLQGAGFAIFFAVMGLPLGVLADRMNRKLLLVAGMIVWSLATLASGLANGLATLLATRIVVGAGEAVLAPAGTSMIGDSFTPADRPRAFSVYALGASIGSGLAFLTIGTLLRAITGALGRGQPGGLHPWQGVFFVLGLPGILLALIILTTVREPLRRELAFTATRLPLSAIAGHLGRHVRAYAAVYGAAVANIAALYVILGWFPTFIVRAYHVKMASVAGVMGLISMIFGATSSLMGGWIIGSLHKRGYKDASLAVIAATLPLIALGVLGMVLADSFAMAMAAYAFTSLVLNIPAVAVLTGINRITPNRLRAQALAVHTLFTSILAQTLGPLAVGLLADHVFTGPRAVGYGLALVVGIACALATLIVLAFRKPFSEANQLVT